MVNNSRIPIIVGTFDTETPNPGIGVFDEVVSSGLPKASVREAIRKMCLKQNTPRRHLPKAIPQKTIQPQQSNRDRTFFSAFRSTTSDQLGTSRSHSAWTSQVAATRLALTILFRFSGKTFRRSIGKSQMSTIQTADEVAHAL